MPYANKQEEKKHKHEYYLRNKKKILAHRREYRKRWYQENKVRLAARAKEYYAENKSAYRARNRRWCLENADRAKKLSTRNYQKHKEEYLQRKKNRYAEDPEFRARIKKQNEEYKTQRMKVDPLFKLGRRLRCRISEAIKLNKWKKTSHTEKILGARGAIVKAHLESQFRPGMTWLNYGAWHIDHVVPLTTAKTKRELLKLCHYKNIQPLWAEENLRKSRGKFSLPVVEKRVS